MFYFYLEFPLKMAPRASELMNLGHLQNHIETRTEQLNADASLGHFIKMTYYLI